MSIQKNRFVLNIRFTEHYRQYRDLLQTEVALPARTTDSELLRVGANISKPSDVDLVHLYNLDDVGLYRTEFDLIGRTSFPHEDELYRTYSEAVEKANGKAVTIRTMDIVADKGIADTSACQTKKTQQWVVAVLV